jgi:ATP phosphoribosyltransferase
LALCSPASTIGFEGTLTKSPTGDKPLKLAVQRSGRLTEPTLDLLHAIGLQFESYGQRLFSHCRNFPLSILYGRDDDIPEYIERGTVDLGIVGRNLLFEEGVEVEEIAPLGFGYCSLVVATLRDAPFTDPLQLLNARVASSYPQSARRYFQALGGEPEIITISGSVEVAPSLGLADAIVELTATGSTLLLNDLRAIATILESEAVLAASPEAMQDPSKRANIDRLMMRINAVQAAKRYKYLMMNAPETALPAIRAIVPGLKSPTVVPLADPGWVAVHLALEEEVFWESIERLRAAGATEILVSSLDKLIM